MKPTIVTAAFAQDAAVLGGVAMVYRELLNQPRKWLKSAVLASDLVNKPIYMLAFGFKSPAQLSSGTIRRDIPVKKENETT